MKKKRGIGPISAQRLARILESTQGTITALEVASILEVSLQQARDILRRLCSAGWIHRVKGGLYVPVPLEAQEADEADEDAWLIAVHHFAPCYIGGWSAAEFWHLTDQIFQTVVVFTACWVSKKQQKIGRTHFLLKKIQEEALFGTQSVWRDKGRAIVSDPHRTLVDLFTYPLTGGGITHCIEILRSYLDSEHCDLVRMASYIDKLSNRIAAKRLGYLIERIAPHEIRFVEFCLMRRRLGFSSLDPGVKSGHHVVRWQLIVPRHMFEGDID